MFKEYFNYVVSFIHSNRKILFLMILISVLMFFLLSFTIWVIVSFHILKYTQKNFHENFYFDDYTDNCKKCIKLYGDFPIKNVYLVRQPIGKINSTLLDILTFNEASNKINSYNSIHKNNKYRLTHTSILFELKTGNNLIKHINIEKNNNIVITPNFMRYDKQDVMKVNLSKKKQVTINDILEITKKRLGKEKYFNWHLYKNNCLRFSVELLISLSKKNKKYMDFLYENDFLDNVSTSDFKQHILNTSMNMLSFVRSLMNTIY